MQAMPSAWADGGSEVGDGLSVEGDGAGVGLVRAGDDLDERAFAGAVFAEERVHFAGAEIEVDPAERPRAAKGFGELAELEQRGRHRCGAGRCDECCDGREPAERRES